MAESIFDLIYGTDRFKKPQTGLMSSFDDTDYGDLTAQPEKDYLQGMKTRDKIALLTSAMPVVGGITGTYADMMNMIENPEERTKLNAGLMALNWIPSGRATREIVEKTKDMIPDPRFRKRKSKTDTDQKQINALTTETEADTNIAIPEVSITDLEGRGIISSMADRTMGGKIVTHVNGIELKHPVITRGGDQYMTMGENVKAGNIWASDTSPVSGIINRADELKKITGETPILAPFKMAPSSGDYSHQTLEMMLAYNDTVLPRSVKSEMNKALKEIDPTFVGLNSPKFQAWLNSGGKGSGNIRKQMLQMLDRDFRTKGGLSLPEARVSVTDVNQLSGVDDASLRYLGTVEGGRSPYSNHPTYAEAIKGEPVGVLKEKNLSLLDLLDESDLNRGLTNTKAWSGVDRKNIDPTDMYLLRTSPKSGVITEKKLRELESKGLLDTATKTTKPKESGLLANITTKNADKVKKENAFRPYNEERDDGFVDLVGDYKFGIENDEFRLQYLDRGSKEVNYKNTSDDWYTIIDKSTGKKVGRTRLAKQTIGDRDPTITGLVNVMIDDKNKGVGTKFINSLKKSSKADPYSVSPQLEVYDITPTGKRFWDKMGAKEYYNNQKHLGGEYGKVSLWDSVYDKAGEIKPNYRPDPVSDDFKGKINTILDWRE